MASFFFFFLRYTSCDVRKQEKGHVASVCWSTKTSSSILDSSSTKERGVCLLNRSSQIGGISFAWCSAGLPGVHSTSGTRRPAGARAGLVIVLPLPDRVAIRGAPASRRLFVWLVADGWC
jgi:hypothetical protein